MMVSNKLCTYDTMKTLCQHARLHRPRCCPREEVQNHDPSSAGLHSQPLCAGIAGEQLRKSQFLKLKLDAFLTMVTEEAAASVQATCAHLVPFFLSLVPSKPEEQQVHIILLCAM